jgi:hypothetical protein
VSRLNKEKFRRFHLAMTTAKYRVVRSEFADLSKRQLRTTRPLKVVTADRSFERSPCLG